MGYRSLDSFDWTSYQQTSQTYAKASTAQQAFVQRSLHDSLNPALFNLRESRNSQLNPQSTPVILALDVTGSMGEIARIIAAEKLGILIKEIFDRKPITDPHIMFAGIGDVRTDQAPFQVSQFETDMKIMEQLGNLFVEGNGGGNGSESYNLMWHFAAFHTSCDAFEKDGRKGFLFTFGDEGVPPNLNSDQLRRIYGDREETVATNSQLIEILTNRYHVFHLRIQQGSSYSQYQDKDWQSLLGERSLPVPDYTKLSEIIVSTMQIVGGVDKDSVIKSWDDNTAKSVSTALANVSTAVTEKKDSGIILL